MPIADNGDKESSLFGGFLRCSGVIAPDPGHYDVPILSLLPAFFLPQPLLLSKVDGTKMPRGTAALSDLFSQSVSSDFVVSLGRKFPHCPTKNSTSCSSSNVGGIFFFFSIGEFSEQLLLLGVHLAI